MTCQHSYITGRHDSLWPSYTATQRCAPGEPSWQGQYHQASLFHVEEKGARGIQEIGSSFQSLVSLGGARQEVEGITRWTVLGRRACYANTSRRTARPIPPGRIGSVRWQWQCHQGETVDRGENRRQSNSRRVASRPWMWTNGWLRCFGGGGEEGEDCGQIKLHRALGAVLDQNGAALMWRLLNAVISVSLRFPPVPTPTGLATCCAHSACVLYSSHFLF